MGIFCLKATEGVLVSFTDHVDVEYPAGVNTKRMRFKIIGLPRIIIRWN